MKDSTRLLVFLVSALMLSTAAVYFLVAYSEYIEDISEHGTQIEIMLFSAVGIAHVPLAIWMLKNKMNSRAPYVISIIISLVLIGLYGAARIIILPTVGLESSVGIIDIISKVLQVGIIVTSLSLLPELKKNQRYEIHEIDKK